MTTWRKWFVRGLALAIVASAGVGVYMYQRYTNPEQVRSQVLDKLGEQFPGAVVNVESARLRLLGGISVEEFRLTRREDPEQTEFLHVPSAILYHDKESLLDGHFDILKMELQRPRIRLIRSADGNWNISGILGPSHPDQPVPTLVIKQGTVILEDHRLGEGAPPLEIKDVNLTMVNDPVSTLTITGSGSCDVLGNIQLTGTVYRGNNEATFNIEAPSIPVGPPLIQRLYPFAPDFVIHARFLEGIGRLQAEVRYQPDSERQFSHDIHFRLTKGKFHHALLPLPLENMDASVRINNGQVTLDHCTAHSGPTSLKVSFKELFIEGDRRWEQRFRELDAKIERLPMTKEIMDRANLGKFWDDYSPSGEANVTLSLRRDQAGGWHKHCVVQPLDAQAVPRCFPFPFDHISGVLEQEDGSDSPGSFKLNLVGKAGLRPVFVQGFVKGTAPDHEVDLTIWGDDVALTKQLEEALPERYQALARSFKPTGKGSFKTTLKRDPVTKIVSNRHLIHFRDCTVCYDRFPYPLENVSLTLDVLPDHWEVRDFRGSRKGGVFTGKGGSFPGAEADRVVLQLEGKTLQFDDELEQSLLNPELRSTCKMFEPRGTFDFACTVSFDTRRPSPDDHLREPVPEIDITLWPKHTSITPRFFPYSFHELEGKVRYANRWVTIEGLQARNGSSTWTLPRGYCYLKPEGGIYSILYDLEANPLLPDQQFVSALPESLRGSWNALDLKDPFGVKGLLVVETKSTHPRPDVYWDGVCALRDARIRTGVQLEHVTGKIACRGRHNGDQILGVVGNLRLDQATVLNQPFEEVSSPFLITREAPDVLRFRDLWMRCFGGSVYGPVRVEFGSTVRYELNLTASEMKLEEFGRHNLGEHSQISGVARANLHLTGQGADLHTLKGNGEVRVPEGKMYNLPLALDLLKVLGLRPPDRTAFEEANAAFEIDGPRVQFKELNLVGNAISLRGKGDMNLNGTDLNLDFNADWGRMHQMLPPLLNELPSALSDQLLKIRMRGEIGNVRCTKELLPPLTEPIKKVLDQGKSAKQKAQAQPAMP
jgi:hypothetical protein